MIGRLPAHLTMLLQGDLAAVSAWFRREQSIGRFSLWLIAIATGCGMYGFSIGLWRAPLQGIYVAVKLPLLIMLTLGANGLINGMFGALLGSGMSFRQTMHACLMSFALFAVIVGSLSPITIGMVLDAPRPNEPGAQNWYRVFLLLNTVVIAFAGIIANHKLLRLIEEFSGSRTAAWRTLIAWLAGNLFVGAQLSFNLRPFFGNPNLPVQFLRPNPFDGNFYEAVWQMTLASLPHDNRPLLTLTGALLALGGWIVFKFVRQIRASFEHGFNERTKLQQTKSMNPTSEPNASSPEPQAPALPSNPLEFRPLDKPPTLIHVIESLLKQPGRILFECQQGHKPITAMLLLGAVICLAVFGGLLGTFSGGAQYWAAPAKVIIGVLAATLICLPSLYIFSALGGLDARLQHVASLLLTAVTLTALLLLGFSPVIWIFSQSTESVAFMGFLALVFWVTSLAFGIRLLMSVAGRFGLKHQGYLILWVCIFFVVTIQMSTALRPIIGRADTFLPTSKKFFLEHWIDEINGGSKGGKASAR